MRPIKLTVKGLNSFIEEQSVDFEKLTDRGLFGIFGPTGSGKSTILDGITLALYGDVSRKSSNYINTNCEKANVSFEFQISGAEIKRYIVTREFKRDKKSGNPVSGKCKMVDITNGEDVLADKVKSVTDKCKEVIGLSLEDFTRTVVLPQGKFSEFLKLEGKPRREMLERLFNLGQYGDELSGKLLREISKEKNAGNILAGQLKGYEDISESKKIEKEENLKISIENLKNINDELKEIEKDFKEKSELWNLQLEISDYKEKESILVERGNEINLIREKIKFAESANKVNPYVIAYEDTLKNIDLTEKELSQLKDKCEELKGKKLSIELKWNNIKKIKDEKLPQYKIQEEKINSEREFEQLLSDFESKKIDGDALNRILQKKALENEDLQRQIKELSKYSTVDATTKAIAELQYYKSIVEKQTATILELQKRLREIDEQHRSEVYNLQQHLSSAIDEKFKEAQKRKEAEEYADKIKIEKEKEVQIERLKVEFYKKQSTPETDALIHHVKNNNSKIKQEINNLMANLNMMPIEKTYKNKLLESLFVILRLSNKSLKATDLILESDLSEADIQKINLPSFISGYLSTIDTKLKVHYKTKIEYFMVFGSKLDLALIIDNFLDNSEAWKAKNIWFSCYLQNDNMILNIYDDGEGLSQEFSNNPNEIFQFRKTGKNNGTGFGLYLVQESLRKMNATIIVDSPVNKTGMNFKIIFK